MIKSIRGRLQAWYALVLLTVVGTFAGVLFVQVRQARFQDIDRQLQAGVMYLDVNLRRFPVSELDPSRTDPGPPLRDKNDGPPPRDKHFDKGPKNGPPLDKRDGFDKGGPDRKRPDDKDWHPGPPPPPKGKSREQLLAELVLPKEIAAPDDDEIASADARHYFAVWRADGTLLKASHPPPEGSFSERGLAAFSDRPRLADHGDQREAVMIGPEGSRILVGRPIARELAEVNAYAWQVAGAGVIVLGIGLLGGWLISGRIVRPIAMISATASAISANNLSGRIDTENVDSELAKLAAVLNDMFERLQSEFERQARFTADASHELRTPLAVIHSHAQLALSRARTAEEYRATIENCLLASTRMVSLVDGLMTLARADADKLQLSRKPVELGQLIADNIAMLEPVAETKKVTITADLAPVTIQGDGQRLAQVITNLLTNAIRYNRTTGQVFVKLRAEDKDAVIEVSDTGCGIPDENQEQIFERFFRVDKARNRQSGGHGLGLAICKSIIAAHGGTVGFKSRWNEGTTFWVRLPCN